MYEVFGETEVKAMLAVTPGDSIRKVSQKIQTPYETVRQAVNTLEEHEFLSYDNGLYVTDRDVVTEARELAAASARVSPPSIKEMYVLPHFTDLEFAFTRIDAVYVWTRGGYQIARSPDDYPLFIAVQDSKLEEWKQFFDDFNVPVAEERQPPEKIDGPLQVVLEPRTELDIEWIEGYPVIPREETIEYMQEHYPEFESALDMLERMYDDLTLGIGYTQTPVEQP